MWLIVIGFFYHKYLKITEFLPQITPQEKEDTFLWRPYKDFHKKGHSPNYFTLNKSGINQFLETLTRT